MFELILNRFSSIGPEGGCILSAEELAAWPHDDVVALKRLNLLKKASPAKAVECKGCEESCLMPVHVCTEQDGRPARLFVACDKREDTGRVLIEPAALEQWQVDIDLFVSLLASTLDTGHVPDEIIPQQVFYLGSLTINGKRRSVIFVSDNETLISSLEEGLLDRYPHPFFLVAVDPSGSQEIKNGAVFSLRQLLILSDKNSFSFDRETLEHLISLDDGRNVKASLSGTNVSEENVFRKEGQKWVLRFKGGNDIFCNDNKGFLYISYLLDSQGREIHSQQLMALADGRDIEKSVGVGGVLNSLEIRDSQIGEWSQNPILDEQARREYKSRINELRSLIDEAESNRDFALKDKYQEEYVYLRKEIISATGLGGRQRSMTSDAEKARKKVWAAYNRALKIIQNEDSSLHSHLKNSIQMGEYCIYQPEENIIWAINKN